MVLTACDSSASTRPESATTATATPVAVGTTVPAGTTLRVGDQLDFLRNLLHVSGQDTGFSYQVEYSAFIGGPPMLQAFEADALDTGFVGSTPLIFAQAGGQGLRAVAGFSYKTGGYQLLTAPGHREITGWASLKGRKVAYQKGTAGEAVVLQALDSAGLKLSDVTTVDIPQTQVATALQGGSADAGVSVEPLTSAYLAKNPTAAEVGTTRELPDRSSFVIAGESALKNSAKTAAEADYLTRLVKAFAYLESHPGRYAESIYVKQYGLTSERASAIVARTGTPSFFPLPGDIVPAQQRLADLFRDAGEIPAKVDVAKEFDPRFNQVVAKAQGQ
ncbi:ABC transporter substrate-binding protein [Frankia sp. R82]|uniref:ABC transporter substrate-binding protein n=1 Tax=Frankia sp. R82 TaxID=2950553 RepID=UPI0020435CEC|nr:ABC transporter substrate-binding protein [Frankia sp. R82]MCM3886254.1 ABC transporter substrate-binding protein [Frankia sp. R82]